jgi:hypothetical protein
MNNKKYWRNYPKPPGATETEEQRVYNQEMFDGLAEGLPHEAITDWGYGPMIYLADSIWLCKSGYMYADE